MATVLSAGPALRRPLAAMLFDHAESTPDGEAIFLPQADRVVQKDWRELAEEVLQLAAMLSERGVEPGDRVVLWSDNSYEWIVADLAMQLLGLISIPLHGSLPVPAAAALMAHAEPRLAIFATGAMAEGLRSDPSGATFAFPVEIVAETSHQPSLMERAKQFSADEGRRLAEARQAEFDPDSVATILYSSGTSGEPKAVALTHANLSSNAYAVIVGLSESSSERRMNFLPLSHIYARTCDLYAWLAGGSQFVLARSRDTVLADCLQTRPTMINGVPFFYQRIAQKVAEAEAAGAAVTLQQLFGGNLRACVCGGAALPVATFDFYHERGLLLLPGYGLTESSPVIAMSSPHAFRRGTVGKAIPGIEVAFAADGELLTRGPHVMKEYWKDAALTSKTISAGWLSTGDLGAIDADGYISITGRKKELIALSTGKKVVPPHIEGVLSREPLISQSMVVGNDQPYLAALIVPDFDLLAAWAEQAGLPPLRGRALLETADVRALFEERIRCQLEVLPPYERVKRFCLIDEPFTVTEGLITPKLSLRREMIQRKHAAELESLYAGGGATVGYEACSG